MEVLLAAKYSYKIAAKMVSMVALSVDDKFGQYNVQRKNVGRPEPNPNWMPPYSVCAAAVSEIEMRIEGDKDKGGVSEYVVRWDNGYITMDQLSTMLKIQDARACCEKLEVP